MSSQKTLKNRTIFCRDNLEILRGINSNTVDLIYLDPPFNKKKQFTAPIGSTSEGASFQDYFREGDIKEEWLGLIADKYPTLYQYIQGIEKIGHISNKYYLCYMAVRIIEMHRVLKDTGSLYLHCDQTMSHYLKLLLDCIFGDKNFRNEVIWCYKSGGVSKRWFGRKHDIIYFYSKSENGIFNIQKIKSYGATGGGHGGKVKYYKDKNGTYSIVSMLDWWNISMLSTTHSERVGYPTQKPVALLERIIKASSKENDIVLDPFCGCCTTMIASERLNRQWVGIDISEKAFDLIKSRLAQDLEQETEFLGTKHKVLLKDIIYRKDIPKRTDLTDSVQSKDSKHFLFGQQQGVCKGCDKSTDFKLFDIDHIIAKSKGGGDNIENLQLLCRHCNVTKGNRTMEDLKVRLKELHII